MSERNKESYDRSRWTGKLKRLGALACVASTAANVAWNAKYTGIDDVAAYFNESLLNQQTTEVASEFIGESLLLNCKPELEANDGSVDAQLMGYVGKYAIVLPGFGVVTERLSPMMHLRTDICEGMVSSRFDDNSVFQKVDIEAAAVVAHEFEHTLGVVDEAAATCYAAQKMPNYFMNMGVPESDSMLLGSLAASYYSIHLSANYLSYECRDGGALDIDAYPIFAKP